MRIRPPQAAIALLLLIVSKTALATEAVAPGELRPDWKPGVAGTDTDVVVPIFYQGPRAESPLQMLVVANEHGAAAIRMTEDRRERKITWMKYEYRYESFDGKVREAGDGEVYEQRSPEGVLGGNVYLEIKDLSVGWTLADNGCCWIYYSPEKVRTHVAKAQLYMKQRRRIPGRPGEFAETPALNLQRFRP